MRFLPGDTGGLRVLERRSCVSSPVVAGGQLLLRTRAALWAIGTTS